MNTWAIGLFGSKLPCSAVIQTHCAVNPDAVAVIPDLIRDPWIAGLARNDNYVARNDNYVACNDNLVSLQ